MDKVSYVIRQEKLTFMLTTPLRMNNEIADHIYKHGDGVKVLALKVEDATDAWEQTTKRGGKSYMEPVTLKDDKGQVVLFFGRIRPQNVQNFRLKTQPI